MENNIKEQMLKTESIDDIIDIEDSIIGRWYAKKRNEFYNDLLKDEKVKKHLASIFNVPEEILGNALEINGCPPIDCIEEDDE